ncbi:DUF1016 N-terminal domain-containing protein [Nostoc sp.]|uniref:DUF1016 N-terminal domain-containing protein n=1 Tax=Nostoc sp. TaxID=1180 RepID=UPI002FFB4286
MVSKILRNAGSAKVINRLAADLQKAFPEMKGFSLRNLKCIQAFAEAYPYEQLVQQAAALIAWGHDKKTEFSLEEIGNEVAKIRSEINANTTKDSDLI